MCSFNNCEMQKYTTLWYTNDAAPVLDLLNGPEHVCGHKDRPKKAGGRGENGTFVSAEAGVYPSAFCVRLAMAVTCGRTGDPRPLRSGPAVQGKAVNEAAILAAC